MKADSNFLKKYKKQMTNIMCRLNPDWEKDDVEEIITDLIKENVKNPVVMLDNNFTGESRDTTLLSVLDWTFDRKPIICGNATFYKNQYEAINPIAKMLEGFLTQRKKYKKMMFKVGDPSLPAYKDFDRKQQNEKQNANSYYGASGAQSSAFYSLWSGPATTLSAQSVISTAETLFEGFIGDNYTFLNLTELIEWSNKAIKKFHEEDGELDDFIQKKSGFDLLDRLLKKILKKEEDDEDILLQYISSLSDDEITLLYYKNNMKEFFEENSYIQDLIIDIFENVLNLDYAKSDDENWIMEKLPTEYYNDFVGKTYEDYNKFVNNQYFMDPNDVPNTISATLALLNEYVMKYVYCRYLSVDRIYRLKNFKRKVVTVIDTDSNILSLDTIINFIMDNIVKERSFGRDRTHNIFICVNMLAYLATSAVTDILLTYGEYSNIPEEFRPIYNMKNEFLFLKLVIGETKKRYISRIVLREGNYMNPPKYDIKGLIYKALYNVICIENRVNCWELLIGY